LRGKYLPKFFEAAGEDIQIYEGVRFRGAHKLRVGDRVHIGVSCFINAEGGVELGDDAIVGPGVKIWSMNHVFEDPDKPVMQQGYSFKSVKIGRDVWIGSDAFIMPGADIGEGSIISAGAVVGGKEVPSYSILAGNPARKIGTRKKEQSGKERDEGSADDGEPKEAADEKASIQG